MAGGTVKKAGGAPKLLSGGNPQIAKGYGDGPVQDYIAAMPEWKSAVGREVDALISAAVPGVVKAVKWNSPFYGVEKDVWFCSMHVFSKFVRITFFAGSSLEPPPSGTSKYPAVRYFDIHEGEVFADQFRRWVEQASRLPGEKL